MEVTGTFKTVGGLYYPFLQTGCNSKYLGWGSRFIGIADTEIPPYLVPRHLLSIRQYLLAAVMVKDLVLGDGFPVIFPSVYMGCFLFAQCHQILLGVSAYVPGIIKVKHAAGAHGQYLAVIGIHDNGGRDLAAHGCLPLIDIFLDNILDVHVNGAYHGLAVGGGLHHALKIGVLIQITVLAPIHSDEAAVIVLLNPAGSHAAVTAGKSNHAAGH